MNSLTIFEKYSNYWPVVAVGSAVTALIIYLAYLYSDSSVLVEGYLGLGAFCFFALSVFSFFKWRDGQIRIDIQPGPGRSVIIDYSLRDKQLSEEQFDLKEFAEVVTGDMPDRSIYNNFASRDRSVMFRRLDGGNWFYLIQVHDRVIPLNEENALKVKDYILQQLPADVTQ